jgi:hypothetical protein
MITNVTHHTTKRRRSNRAIHAACCWHHDSTLYVNRLGTTYLVRDPESVGPIWQECDLEPGHDAKPANLDAHELQSFERCRVAYGSRE